MELNVHSTLYLTLQMATLIRCSFSVILRPLVPFVHDAASKFHPDQRLPVLHRVIAIVGIDRRTLQEVGFLQRCLEMFDVALIGSRCLLGQNQTILVSCRMALVAEVELSHLLAPPGLSVHIGHDNFLEHGFFRGPPHLSRDDPPSPHTPSGHGDGGGVSVILVPTMAPHLTITPFTSSWWLISFRTMSYRSASTNVFRKRQMVALLGAVSSMPKSTKRLKERWSFTWF